MLNHSPKKIDRRSGVLKKRRRSKSRYKSTLSFEELESRRVLAPLLGIDQILLSPIINYDNGGTASYNEANNVFTIDATPIDFSGQFFFPFAAAPTIDVNVEVDESGNVVPGSSSGLVLTGTLDLDNDFVPDFSGVLLTGDVTEFGFQESGANDDFDFRFDITGGLLANQFYAGRDLGVTLNLENSTFSNDFTVDFGGSPAKGKVGGLEIDEVVGEPSIDIQKSTNGVDADAPTGPLVAVGSTVDFEYVVTNTGNVSLGSVNVTDDQGVTVTFQAGDTNNDGLLDVDETWIYTGNTIVTAGQYVNVGSVTASDSEGTDVVDSDPSHHFGVEAAIDIEKTTNGNDADTGTGAELLVGSIANFEYVVTNSGNVALANVDVVDDQGVTVTFVSGDTNNDGLLDVDETWTYIASTIVTVGQYTNIGTVVGEDATGTIADPVSDEDPSNHFGVVADINIMKFVDQTMVTEEMFVLDFEGLSAGTIVSNQFPGVVISAENRRTPSAGNLAMIFDSSNPTGNDLDLGSPNAEFGGPGIGAGGTSASDGTNDVALGNVLIISEDGDSSDPDDEARGGVFTITFDNPVRIDYIELLDIDTNEPGGSVVTINTASGTQQFSIASLGNNSFQTLEIGVENVISMTVDFVSSGAITELKYTEITEQKVWYDANDAPGPSFNVGDTIEFSYKVTNPGDIGIGLVSVVDDNATPGFTDDDFVPLFIGGDIDNDGILDVGEEWIYEASIVAMVAGQFVNIGSVAGEPVGFAGETVTDDDPGNYTIVGVPGIDIEKFTNGADADDPNGADVPQIAVGDPVFWTYEVTNTGDIPFGISDVNVVDDNGTVGDTSDDFSPVLDPLSDVGNDGILSPGETWVFTASGIAESLGVSSGESTTMYLTGNSGLDGTDGNIRSFSADGITVNASGFSRDASGNWQEAFVGAFGGGLGVTDTSEGNGGNKRHKVDNIHRQNYVLFEFSEAVVMDAAFLASVTKDSDISVWIGTIDNAFFNHQTLSDSLLAGLFNETNNTNSSRSRWANINNGEVVGNVLVIAASVTDATPEDQFKIKKLKFKQTQDGVFGNLATVTANGVSDSDMSHYRNPTPADSAEIGNFVWNDVNMNGQQDVGEDGIADVVVELLTDGGQVIDTTMTDSEGFYRFDGLPAGDYKVRFVAPENFVFSEKYQGTNADNGSNANQSTGVTDTISLRAHEIDNTIDAGLYESILDTMFEAEDGVIESPWQVFHSAEASGGQFIKAPNGTGSHYNHVPNGKSVKYDFVVSESGAYEISGLVKATNGRDNSVWVKVGDQPWVQWHIDTSSGFEWNKVTDGWNQNSVTFDLIAGVNHMEIRVREDGTKLDKFMVSQVQHSTILISANDYVEGSGGDWVVDTDDDGNEFLVAGGSHHYSAPEVGDILTYQFNVAEDGDYFLFGHVSASDNRSNSFWVRVDGGEWVEWHLTVTGEGIWQWQVVTDNGGYEPVVFNLSEGTHTLEISVRESGTAVDWWAFTTDENYNGDGN